MEPTESSAKARRKNWTVRTRDVRAHPKRLSTDRGSLADTLPFAVVAPQAWEPRLGLPVPKGCLCRVGSKRSPTSHVPSKDSLRVQLGDCCSTLFSKSGYTFVRSAVVIQQPYCVHNNGDLSRILLLPSLTSRKVFLFQLPLKTNEAGCCFFEWCICFLWQGWLTNALHS